MAALGGGWADALRKAAQVKTEQWPPFEAAAAKPERQWPAVALPLANGSACAVSAASASPAQTPRAGSAQAAPLGAKPASAKVPEFSPSAKHSPPASPNTPPTSRGAHAGTVPARAKAVAHGTCSATPAPSAQEMRALEEANAILTALFGPNADLSAVNESRRNPSEKRFRSADGAEPSPRPAKTGEKPAKPQNEQRCQSKIPASPRPPPAQRRSAGGAGKKNLALGAQSPRVSVPSARPASAPSAAELPAPSSFYAGLSSSGAVGAKGGESPVVTLFEGEATFPAIMAELWALQGGRRADGAKAAEKRERRQGVKKGERGEESAAQGAGATLARGRGQAETNGQADSLRESELAPPPESRAVKGSGADGCASRGAKLTSPSNEAVTLGVERAPVANATSPVEAEATALLDMVTKLLSSDKNVTVNGGDCTEMIKGTVEKFKQELLTKLPGRDVGEVAGAGQGEGGGSAGGDGGNRGVAIARMAPVKLEHGEEEGVGEERSAKEGEEQQQPFQPPFQQPFLFPSANLSRESSGAPDAVHVPDGGFSLDHPVACAMWEPSNGEPASREQTPAQPAAAQTASALPASGLPPEEQLQYHALPQYREPPQFQPQWQQQQQQQQQWQQQQQQQQQWQQQQQQQQQWQQEQQQQWQQPPHHPLITSSPPPPPLSDYAALSPPSLPSPDHLHPHATHAAPHATHPSSHPASGAADMGVPAASPGFETADMDDMAYVGSASGMAGSAGVGGTAGTGAIAPPTPAAAAPAPVASSPVTPYPVTTYPPHPTNFAHSPSTLSLALAPIHASASFSASAPLSGPGTSSASGSAAASASDFTWAAGPTVASDSYPADAQRAADFAVDFPPPVHGEPCLNAAAAITELPLFPASTAAREAAAAISSLGTEDEYNKEMGELKTLVTKALEKKGVLARLKAELRASIFEVIDDKDKTASGDEQRAVRGGCSEQAKNLHDSKTGHLLTALLCEYLEWGEMDHTLKVYLSECNLPPVYPRRPKLEDELGLPSSNAIMTPGGATRPLLHELIDAYFTLKAQVKSGATGTSSSGGGLLSRATARSSSPSDASLPVSSSPPQKSPPLFCCAPPLARNAVSASDSADEENPGDFTAVYPSDLRIANPKEVTSTADEVEKLRKDETDRQRRRRRTCCCRVACWSLIALAVVIVGLGVAGLVAYLTVSKQQPEVKVEQINIIRVGITKSGGGFLGLKNFRLGLSALLNVTALVYNPNNRDVEAEDISIDVKFFDMHVANVTLPGVVGMSKGGSAELTVPLDIVDAPLATLSPASLLTTPLLHGRAEMRVVVGTAARVKYWGISSPRVMVHVECTMQLDPFSAKKYNEQCAPSISL
ncbi:unnamed protein product [Closterium sp. Yama58-4]|nr:unnamed protein product [Closterium sp. Yama58-4]